jgi:hypothetical protein
VIPLLRNARRLAPLRAGAPGLSLGILAAFAAGQQVDRLPAGPGGPSAEQRAFVEVVADRKRYVVNEPVEILLRVGFDSKFFEAQSVPLFRRPMDVPIQLQAGWLDDLPGTRDLPTATSLDAERLSLALDDAIVEAVRAADVEREGRAFTVLEIARRYLPELPGELAIPAPALRFAYATEFREDLVQGRVPVDWHEAVVAGTAVTLVVEPLPAAGRPREFIDAVGHFTVSAQAAPLELELGQSLQLTLVVEGRGNLAVFEAPRLDALAGFSVFRRVEERGPGRRTLRYELSPRSADIAEIPAIPFAFYDPEPPAGYRTVRTEPITIAVRDGRAPPPPAEPGAERQAEPVTDVDEPERAPDGHPAEAEPPSRRAAAILAAALVAFGACAALLLRRRVAEQARRRELAAAASRLDQAVAEARAMLERREGDPAQALVGFLAGWLGCTRSAVIAPDLPARLARVGLSEQLATAGARRLDDLLAHRYGGEAAGDAVAEAGALLDELEAAFRAALTGARSDDPSRR